MALCSFRTSVSFSTSVSFGQNILCHKTEAHYIEYYSVSNGYLHAASLSSDMTEGQHTTVLSPKALLCTLMLLRGSIGEIWAKRFLHESITAALWKAAFSMSVPAWKLQLCGSIFRLDRQLFLRLLWICHISWVYLVNGEIASPYEMYVICVHFNHTIIRRREICKKFPT